MKPVKLSTLCALPFALAASAHALTFDFGDTSAYGADLTAALAKAGNNWSSRMTDNVTVKIDFSFANLGQNILGGTMATYRPVSYSDYRAALAGDAKSALDATAVGHLETGSTYQVASNGLDGVDPNDFYLLDLTGLSLTTANLHAVGLLSSYAGSDADMQINDQFAYDFNPDDGITAGSVDFVGVITHELGHALGFSSGVDDLEQIYAFYSQFGFGLIPDDFNSSLNSLDLFRYGLFGTDKYRNVGLLNYSKYFSVDGTNLGAQFATGSIYGDGEQASHWKDGLGLGIMDPTANPDGSAPDISLNDLAAFDAIGYDIKPVPEPATFVALGAGLVALARRRRR